MRLSLRAALRAPVSPCRAGRIAVLVHVWLGFAAAAAAQAPTVLTPAEAVRQALAKNDRLITQRDSIEQADLGVRLARRDFVPRITPNILGSFGQTNVSSQTYSVDVLQRFTSGTELRLNAGTATAQIPGLSGGDVRFYNADTTLTLSQPLLKGFGGDVARRSLTSAERRRADADMAQALAEQQVAIDVISAYYRVVAQEGFVQVADQSLERSRALLAASEAKLQAGLVSQLDVLRAEQLVTQAEIQLLDARAAIEDARDHLLFVMGSESTAPFEVLRDIPEPDDAPVDVDRLTALALANRLDVKRQVADVSDADRQIRYARNQLLPQVDVNVALTRRTTADTFRRSFGLEGFQFATFFTIGMPVDRTGQLVAFRTSVIDRERRQRELDTARRQVADDVKRIVRDRERLARGVGAAAVSVRIARQEVDVARLRYERGLSNNLDVVTAEAGLLAAESRRIQVLAEAAVARLRFRAVLGVFDPRRDVDGAVIGGRP